MASFFQLHTATDDFHDIRAGNQIIDEGLWNSSSHTFALNSMKVYATGKFFAGAGQLVAVLTANQLKRALTFWLT